jgi:hypothetical protein
MLAVYRFFTGDMLEKEPYFRAAAACREAIVWGTKAVGA